jgi:exo-beta-1,3-glucanase (GH17 family)
MNVYLGIYNVPTDGGAAYVRQRDTIVDALKTYGEDHVLGITVGNEFMLKLVATLQIEDTTLTPLLQLCDQQRR